MAAGLNLGVNAATQPWIALLDADDFWDHKIALQWKATQSFPSAAIISCDMSMLSGHKVTPQPEEYVQARWKDLKPAIITDHCRYVEKVDGDLLARFFIATPAAIIRRDVFSSVGFFDESLIFGQTLEFFARVLARYPLAFVERPLVFQRVHDGNHTNDFAGWWVSYLSIVDRMLKNPDLYPEGAGLAYRARLKTHFHQTERDVARQNSSNKADVIDSRQA